ncbi:unknown protein [Microcystis aeruginosa NIES-843]|uniref:Uncharacterized protein n=1 Tax=Microcystis aeruginosa (strain NIES-843 / IAM M-2473) TaxID=449447 RepID=B0JG36_MICAN|nr:unknown protein [Microcystis aeruginosa NIES-843]
MTDAKSFFNSVINCQSNLQNPVDKMKLKNRDFKPISSEDFVLSRTELTWLFGNCYANN